MDSTQIKTQKRSNDLANSPECEGATSSVTMLSTQESDTTLTSRTSGVQNSVEGVDETYIKIISADYDAIELIGRGSFGIVVKAVHRATGRIVAIKIIHNIGSQDYHRRQLISEIQLLRKLTYAPNNVFTTKLIDIIIPP